jgi:hypothetical protein
VKQDAITRGVAYGTIARYAAEIVRIYCGHEGMTSETAEMAS